MLDACGPPFESWGAWKRPAGLMHLFEELNSMYCTAKMGNKSLLQWVDLYSEQFGTDVQLEAETQVRKLEEVMRLENGMKLSITLLASGMGT